MYVYIYMGAGCCPLHPPVKGDGLCDFADFVASELAEGAAIACLAFPLPCVLFLLSSAMLRQEMHMLCQYTY